LSPYLSLALGGNFNWIGDRPSGPGLARGLSSDADHSFALKAGGGLDYFLTNNLAFNTEVGWKMNRRGHIRFAGVIDDFGQGEAGLAKARLRASTVSVLFGVRYFFPKPAGAIVEKPIEKIVTREVVKEVPVVKEVIKEVPGPERVVEVPKYITVERIVFSDIAFDFDKATLTDLGKGRVYLVAQKLKENKSIKVVVEGHTDFIGTDEYNQSLGLRRSNAVREELTRLGISADRMSTVSYGESKPLLDMKTDWARAVNRRVEFEISGEVPAAQK
jgi:outer membrane protein OmpA-like peptidoglycan-associated protein